MGSLSESASARQASRGQKYRKERRLEEVTDSGGADVANHKASGKVKDALCEHDGIEWRNDQSDEAEEKKGDDLMTGVFPPGKDYTNAI